MFLLEFNSIQPLTKINPIIREELAYSEQFVNNALKQWETVFETPHDSFGQIHESFKLEIIESCNCSY